SVDDVDGRIYRVAKVGGAAPATIASGQKRPGGVTAVKGNVAWTNELDGTVRAAIGATAPTDIAKGRVGPSSIALDATALVWAEPTQVAKVQALQAQPGGATSELVKGQGHVGFVATDNDTTYWTDLGAAPADGGAPRGNVRA